MKSKKKKLMYMVTTLALTMSFFLVGVYSAANRQANISGSLSFESAFVWVDYDLKKSDSNLLDDSSFSMFTTTPAWDTNLNTGRSTSSWSDYNSDVKNTSDGGQEGVYHANVVEKDGAYVYKMINGNGDLNTTNYIGINQDLGDVKIKPSTTYRITIEIFNDGNIDTYVQSGLYYASTEGGSSGFQDQLKDFQNTTTGEWETITQTVTTQQSISGSVRLYIYGYGGAYGPDKILYVRNPVLSEYVDIGTGSFDDDQSEKNEEIGTLTLDQGKGTTVAAIKASFTRKTGFDKDYYIKVSWEVAGNLLVDFSVNNSSLTSATGLEVLGTDSNPIEVIVYISLIGINNYKATQNQDFNIYMDLSLTAFT